MRRGVLAAGMCAALVGACAGQQTGKESPGQPAATAEDGALLAQLEEINTRTVKIKDLTADYEQRKFTPLLKAPLVSTGRVRVKGTVVKWDTDKPEPSVMRIDETELRLFYPKQKVVEVYPIGQDMRELSSSPLPRLSVVRKQYAFTRMDPRELDPACDPSKVLAVVMTPTVEAISKHIRSVKVLIDVAGGYATRMEVSDADGERTLIVFSRLRTDTGLSDRDLALEVPAGVTVSRPMQGSAGDRR